MHTVQSNYNHTHWLRLWLSRDSAEKPEHLLVTGDKTSGGPAASTETPLTIHRWGSVTVTLPVVLVHYFTVGEKRLSDVHTLKWRDGVFLVVWIGHVSYYLTCDKSRDTLNLYCYVTCCQTLFFLDSVVLGRMQHFHTADQESGICYHINWNV